MKIMETRQTSVGVAGVRHEHWCGCPERADSAETTRAGHGPSARVEPGEPAVTGLDEPGWICIRRAGALFRRVAASESADTNAENDLAPAVCRRGARDRSAGSTAVLAEERSDSRVSWRGSVLQQPLRCQANGGLRWRR